MRDTTPCGVCEIAREHRAFHLKEPQYVSREEHADLQIGVSIAAGIAFARVAGDDLLELLCDEHRADVQQLEKRYAAAKRKAERR